MLLMLLCRKASIIFWRMHDTIRERKKIMRGIKVDDTPIIPMNQIYYNFVRPHMGLNGKTPAEAEGIGIMGDNI